MQDQIVELYLKFFTDDFRRQSLVLLSQGLINTINKVPSHLVHTHFQSLQELKPTNRPVLSTEGLQEDFEVDVLEEDAVLVEGLSPSGATFSKRAGGRSPMMSGSSWAKER